MLSEPFFHDIQKQNHTFVSKNTDLRKFAVFLFSSFSMSSLPFFSQHLSDWNWVFKIEVGLPEICTPFFCWIWAWLRWSQSWIFACQEFVIRHFALAKAAWVYTDCQELVLFCLQVLSYDKSRVRYKKQELECNHCPNLVPNWNDPFSAIMTLMSFQESAIQ